MSDRIDRLLARLRKGIRKSKQVFERVDGEEWELVVYEEPYPWTVRDLLAHLVSAEEGLLRLAQDVAAGGVGAPEGFDYQTFNALEQGRLADVPASVLLRRLGARREETLAWVEELDDSGLDRVGCHPALGEISVETFVDAIYGHQLMHMRDLMRILP